MVWIPKRTIAECDAILCGKGMPHEMETCVIDGRVLRVYKNLWPSLRTFWLESSTQNKDSTYVVYENQRMTYGTALERSLKAAIVFERDYSIQKGDRVAICSRNLPEYLVAWWGCHLIGAVPVLVNAWLPSDPLVHCIKSTGSKVLLLDRERADRLYSQADSLYAGGVTGVIVLEDNPSHKWPGFKQWNAVLSNPGLDPEVILSRDIRIDPEDNAAIIFTSGTTGLPKGVLSTQRQYLTNLRNTAIAGLRSVLRRGDDLPSDPTGPQRGLLLSVPFFHVTGSTSLTMVATANGLKIVLMRKWDAQQDCPIESDLLNSLVKAENIRVAGGVPSMVTDLMNVLGPDDIDSLLFGGAAAPEQLPGRAKVVFPKAVATQAYGMTETNSVAVSIGGEDYEHRPTCLGLPCLVNDVIIVRDGVVQPPGGVGEIWIRGPDVMKCYWGDPEATKQAITLDGWIRTGDRGEKDAEGFIYMHDRIKDLIIRGGENIATVENALYKDERLREVAVVGVPDEKLGELVAAIVVTKPEFHGKVKESELIELARSRLPYFAVPVMILVQSQSFELTPSAKIVKAPLRVIARDEWDRRKSEMVPTARL
ncbi:acetyl-CoA synthetase-like protein [Trametopsis cervina]|nr:acetyl-CoA synthetase-like protein [Trametopsis cervina]